MASNVIDVMASLTLIMNEETDRLRGHERALDLAELATAKVRLVGVLETELARINREQPGWTEALDDEQRDALANALIALGDASTANAAILERQIDLSAEMMGAVAAEAKRLSGSRTSTYGAQGNVSHMEMATPISINSEY
ncbi:flagellar biosynthesis protein FlgN [Sphingomonas sp. LaA6.9]|uniref:flagellar biosynthesis protein FlgN n=1 Tax=Sphingomonas sp. LaA6.9 TaxID=2919914 RepID=UPI001F502D40|nr:flagellar biosynthesis protein FlgN [Sphingomonas sp. LaA6.9]MCJ8158663.1 flagellar biosynthesis protein FlgN [Sphingomonas sp. LaA6.9]